MPFPPIPSSPDTLAHDLHAIARLERALAPRLAPPVSDEIRRDVMRRVRARLTGVRL